MPVSVPGTQTGMEIPALGSRAEAGFGDEGLAAAGADQPSEVFAVRAARVMLPASSTARATTV